jgi:hypothetical protein
MCARSPALLLLSVAAVQQQIIVTSLFGIEIFNPAIKLIMELHEQIIWLFVLAIPIACIAWTVTHEEVFREPREYCVEKSQKGRTIAVRKFFYLFTCEYCFSHYVTIFMLIITGFQLLFNDWRGYLIAGFALVWIANIYMSLYAFIRIDIKKERIITKIEEKKAAANEGNGKVARRTDVRTQEPEARN